jgi:hypothetical protein
MALDATRWWTVDRGPWTVNTSHGTSLPPDGRGKLKLAAAIVNMAD